MIAHLNRIKLSRVRNHVAKRHIIISKNSIKGNIREGLWRLQLIKNSNSNNKKYIDKYRESIEDIVNYQIQKTIDMFNPVQVHSLHYKHPDLDIYSFTTL